MEVNGSRRSPVNRIVSPLKVNSSGRSPVNRIASPLKVDSSGRSPVNRIASPLKVNSSGRSHLNRTVSPETGTASPLKMARNEARRSTTKRTNSGGKTSRPSASKVDKAIADKSSSSPLENSTVYMPESSPTKAARSPQKAFKANLNASKKEEANKSPVKKGKVFSIKKSPKRLNKMVSFCGFGYHEKTPFLILKLR